MDSPSEHRRPSGSSSVSSSASAGHPQEDDELQPSVPTDTMVFQQQQQQHAAAAAPPSALSPYRTTQHRRTRTATAGNPPHHHSRSHPSGHQLTPTGTTISPPAGLAASMSSGGSKTVTFFDQVPPLVSSSGGGPLEHSVTTAPAAIAASQVDVADVMPSSPPSEQQRVRELEHEVRELTRQLRLFRSREMLSAVSSATSGHNIRPSSATTSSSFGGGVGGAMYPAPSFSSSFGGAGGLLDLSMSTAASRDGRRASSPAPSAPHHYGGVATSPSEPSSIVAGGGPPSYTSDTVTAPAAYTPDGPPQIVTSMHKPLVASTAGGSIIALPVNYLDPNLAPYVVGLQNTSGPTTLSSLRAPHHQPHLQHANSTATSGYDYHLVPCTVVEQRMILFVAPASSRGSAAVFILCTQEGCLRRYTKSVWVEYRPPQDTATTTTLSYHAVNQLTQDLPLPSSATLVDPSENATENMEGLDDGDGGSNNGSGGGDGASAAAGDEDLPDDDDEGGSENGSSVATWTTSNTHGTATHTAVQAVAALHRSALSRRSGGSVEDDAPSPPRPHQGGSGSGMAPHRTGGRNVTGVNAGAGSTSGTSGMGGDRAQLSIHHHLPLTREMLELFQPYVFAGAAAHRGGEDGDLSHIDDQLGGSAGVRTSVPPSECSELVADGDRSSVGGMRHTGGHTHPSGGGPARKLSGLAAVSVSSAASFGGGEGAERHGLDDATMQTSSRRATVRRKHSHYASSASASAHEGNRTLSGTAAAIASLSPRSAQSPLSSSSLPPLPFVVGSTAPATRRGDDNSSIVSASSSSAASSP